MNEWMMTTTQRSLSSVLLVAAVFPSPSFNQVCADASKTISSLNEFRLPNPTDFNVSWDEIKNATDGYNPWMPRYTGSNSHIKVMLPIPLLTTTDSSSNNGDVITFVLFEDECLLKPGEDTTAVFYDVITGFLQTCEEKWQLI